MDILNYLHSISITLTLDNVIVAVGLIIFTLILIYLIYKLFKCFFIKKFKVVDMNISIANIGNISIEKNKDISIIAHKAWVEIMTRKVGLLFEEDKDVIVEVYNSYRYLFSSPEHLIMNYILY